MSLLSLLSVAVTSIDTSAALPAALAPATADYRGAFWVSAAATNYTVANRPHDYPIDMIVIHDIEGSYASAIKIFQDPQRHGSAHYVVSYKGQITQMVAEKDVAWHAGNWDYNTRAIGIEHEGFAAANRYTSPEYYASARLVASICSRWGVPLDRQHVIGHSQVPDPNNPKLFGGADHHTDPGPYWSWTGYLNLARAYAKALPSPPHMMFEASAFSGDGTATVRWRPARTCRTPIESYTVVLQPGNVQVTVPGTTTSATFTGLTNDASYSFTVTAHNQYGDDTTGSNVVTPGTACTSANLAAGLASPQTAGVAIWMTATSTGCANPKYQFAVQDANGNWVIQQKFGGSSWSWDTYHFASGSHKIRVWANHATADPSQPEAFAEMTYDVTPFSMAHWQARYDTSKVPTTWVAGRSQTFPVTVTNIGDVTWPATGHGTVDLDLHFATSAGGSAKQSTWLNSKAFAMPADLGPGASVTMNVTFAAPARTGALVLEVEMVKEQDFWYQQWQPVSVNVAALDKAASYDMSKAPVSWLVGQSQTFQVTVTNTSNQTWLSTGTYRTDLDLHFATSAGGSAKQSTWLNSKVFALPGNLPPGGTATLNVTVTAPSKAGSFVLEAEMVKEHQYWFQNWQAVKVTVS
ncbi:MAG TPA: N-acetylmuramoyl-L-alanine amidase [Candidatus Dormibacteraeota bacterium]